MQKFIGTWKCSKTGELIEISDDCSCNDYCLKYDFSNGKYQKEELIAINIGIPTEINEPETFYIPCSIRYYHHLFTVHKDCLTIDNKKFVKVK